MFLITSCYQEQEIPVEIDFDYYTSSYTQPVSINISNRTTGADLYLWTFEGATPATSNRKAPGVVSYDTPGTYTIRLEAWNDFNRTEKEITIQIDSAVSLDFSAQILINNFAPATVAIENLTEGATSYEWTFEGGEPSSSTNIHPPDIVFSTPGQHAIMLTVSNGSETFSSTQFITIAPPLAAQFSIIPSFEDLDYEAPLQAVLQNETTSGLHYTWSSTGGTISNPTDENPTVFFASPGTYTITLIANNDKESKMAEQTIIVKTNSNLTYVQDVILGVSAAHSSVGSFYSIRLQETLKSNEVTDDNGALIDLVFYAINSSFNYCRFVSPDSASRFTFGSIPHETHTYFINDLNATSITFTGEQFDAMVNDQPLASLSIKEQDTGTAFFNLNELPYIVLFETEDGRKGAAKIKSYVAAGTQSYIIADVKVQKE